MAITKKSLISSKPATKSTSKKSSVTSPTSAGKLIGATRLHGASNKVLGASNKVLGASNKILGASNKVLGARILGASNKVIGAQRVY